MAPAPPGELSLVMAMPSWHNQPSTLCPPPASRLVFPKSLTLPQVARGCGFCLSAWESGHFWISTGLITQSSHIHKRTGATHVLRILLPLIFPSLSIFSGIYLKVPNKAQHSYKISWEQKHKASFQLPHCTHFHVQPYKSCDTVHILHDRGALWDEFMG